MTAQGTEIDGLVAWEALDSRGTPTVGCAVKLAGGATGSIVVPSGASTGTHEAHELRDDDPERYGGRGVRRAVANVTGPLADAVRGLDATAQREVDRALAEADGSPGFQRLGANAVLAVSVASALAAANERREPLYRCVAEGDDPPLLPMPMVNVISGGAHAGGAVDIQDFLVVPIGATTFSEAIEMSGRVRAQANRVAEARGYATATVADEGGLGLPLASNRAALELLAVAIESSGLDLGSDAAIALDVAATQLFDGDGYGFPSEGRTLDHTALIEELASWCDNFPIVSIEDPLAEDDWQGWRAATARLGARQVLGDDLFTTNRERLRRGISEGIANAVLLKPNQNGTLSGTRDVLVDARTAGYATVLSARSGDTEDSFLADLAVGWRTGQIKVGSTTRSERTAKWNRLLHIEAELGDRALFAGTAALGGSGEGT